jgi:endonuclease/exonuclease/phosphatase family metal-dependent hydrolase
MPRQVSFPHLLAGSLLVALVALSAACATRSNYLDEHGPRYAANYAPCQPRAALELAADSRASAPQTIKVVSYNVRYGKEVDTAIDVLLTTPELADADVILLQEMHPLGVNRIATALHCNYVYYPASLRTSGRDFGNAVLTRGRIDDDQKIILPHVNPFNRQQRIAVRSRVELGQHALETYSVHTETPFLPVRQRAEQLDRLLTSLPTSSTPCLIAGDFNTMSKRSLEQFERRFAAQGFVRASAGLGDTLELGPLGFATDHVFIRGLTVVDTGKVASAAASDHIPIWVELAWDAAPPALPVRAGL